MNPFKEKIKKGLMAFRRLDKKIDNLIVNGDMDDDKRYYKFDYLRCLLLHQASPNDYILFKMYNQNHHQRKNTVTFLRHKIANRVMNDYSSRDIEIIGDKRLFNEYMSDYVKRDFSFLGKNDPGELMAFLKDKGTVFYKPAKGTQGDGIRKLSYDNPEDACFLSEAIIEGREFLLEEQIKQNPVINRINPYAVNTLRINTVNSEDGEHPEIIHVALKVSTSRSCVDNLSAGGYVYPVDIDTGKITKRGISYYESFAPLKHPVTEAEIVGIEIPYFDEIKKGVLEMSCKLKNLRYLGWDIAVTEDGWDVIEANTSPGTKLMQCDGTGKYFKIKSKM